MTIKDNGKGIEEEELEKVFDRYYRGTNTETTHAGSGLGMAIAKDIIQKHGGTSPFTAPRRRDNDRYTIMIMAIQKNGSVD